MNKKIEADTWMNCPECKARVKQQNLEYHMKHAHNKKIDETKIEPLETSHKKRQENKTKRIIPKKTIAIITIIFIVVVASISIYFLSNLKDSNGQNDKKSYIVSIDGKGNYTSIQAAIDSAHDNDTIFVSNGTYFENIIITKPIELIGEDKNTTIINGNGLGTIIYISADNVKISGFTIKNAGNTSQNTNVKDAAGIKIESNYNTISNCNISSNLNYGIYLLANPKNTNNIIKNNTFYNNRIGLITHNSKLNKISSNTFAGNTDYGLYFEEQSNENLISDNIFTEDNYGLRIKGSEKNTVVKNLIMNNKYGLYVCCGAKNNIAYNNVFINNTNYNADETLTNNTWDNGTVGNYWDDYNGTDANADGIGDTPYIIYDDNGDRFPLMQQNIHGYFVSIEGKGYYSSIQDAIDAASFNDTIYVSKGTYFENIVITKPIQLIGEDKNTTIINGNGSGTVIQISADYVKISGFAITNGGPLYQNKDAGIKIGSSYNTISYCNISSNKCHGLILYGYPDTTNNIIKFNTFSNNKYGVFAESAKTNNISSNTFTNNTDYGLYLWDQSDDNTISDNIITENNYAIRIKGSTINTVMKNLIMNNKNGLYFCCGADNNIVYNNVFKNNTNYNAKDGPINIWDNGKVGNYWDDYTGNDANGDGIGDTPYIIISGVEDRFPLMQPI